MSQGNNNQKSRPLDVIRTVKKSAINHWQSLLPACGVDVPAKGKHGACPICGGTDRFHFIDDNHHGDWHCRQCDKPNHGDGLDLVARTNGITVFAAAKLVADALALPLPESKPAKEQPRTIKPIAERIAALVATSATGESQYLVKKGLQCSNQRLLKDGSLLLVVQTLDGTITGGQTIKPNGEKRLVSGTQKKGSFIPVSEITGTPDTFIITEGYATALTVSQLHEGVVLAAIDESNLFTIAEQVRTQWPNAKIILAADNDWHELEERDKNGRLKKNVGKIAAEKAAIAINGWVTLPPTALKSDWDDYRQHHGIEAAKQVFSNGLYQVGEKMSVAKSVVINLDEHQEKERDPLKPFIDSRKNGIYYVTPKVDKESGEIIHHEQWLSDAMKVIGRGRDDIEFYLIIQWEEDGTIYTEAVKTGDVGANEGWRQLKAAGLNIATKPFLRHTLSDWLQRRAKKTDWHITHSTGWQHGAYIFPTGEVIGKPEKPVIFCGRTSSIRGYTVAGTPESWRDSVAKLAKGNPFMMLSIASALASPVIGLLRDDGFGVHFYDQSTAGKTTAQSVGCSVFGEPSAMRLTWFATTLGLINEAAAHNNNLLPLDEVGQGSSVKDVANASYALFNGKGKLQGAKGGGNRDILQFKTIAISTGEVDLDTFVRSEGKRLKAGQLVRLLNIPFSSPTVFHGYQDAREHAKAIEKAIADNHGAIGRVWCEYLTQNQKVTRNIIEEAKTRWNGLIPKGAGAQLPRVAERFAILEGALITATHLTGWTEQESRDAIQHCFNAWVAEFGTANKEHQQIREQTEAFLDRFGLNRYAPEPYTYDHATISNLAGYRKDTSDIPNNGGLIHFYTFPDVFETEVSEGFEPKMFARVLAESGMLKKAANGGFKVQGMKHNGSSRKYYVVMYSADGMEE
ncbi:DUF927 domain-containing protein [Xenorhabdus sp. KJ12.1]|uniref:DUF927 domain-containing protein n=1 Tax=Xenorhabdus sp. KJ12.1 TaxID=1851571 RepID=UPI000C0409A8|nr:DUF927 domain-containing protein [Xenorhabdus sp. KJ12.1]PHM69313.1 DNA primase [Xenorhabdus sp. KJ12.1]